MKRIINLLLLFVIMFSMTGCKKKYTITFDSDGGTACEAITLKKGNPLTRPADPIKEGYDFQGWIFDRATYVFARFPGVASVPPDCHL
jgi:hypothetical protein